MALVIFTFVATLSLLVGPTIAFAEPTTLTGTVTHVRDGDTSEGRQVVAGSA